MNANAEQFQKEMGLTDEQFQTEGWQDSFQKWTNEPLNECFRPTDKDKGNAYRMAEWFRKFHRLYAISNDPKETIWAYGKPIGIWESGFEMIVRKMVRRVGCEYASTHLNNETVNNIRDQAYNPSVKLGSTAPEKIVVRNKVLSLSTGEVEDFNADDYHIIRIDVEYDPKADCPQFKKFLEEVVINEDDRLAIEEFLGYCLVGDYRFADIMILVGGGRNGKSSLLKAITKFLGGNTNVSAMTLQMISENKFAPARLHKKLANVCPDIPSDPIRQTGTLKTLTGGDLVAAEEKFKDGFDFENRAKLWFSGNLLPPAWDNTDAFRERIRVIEFLNQFLEGGKDTKDQSVLVDSLTTDEELSGILNLALAGWQRYKKNRKLSGSLSMSERTLNYIKRSDPIEYFLTRYIKEDESLDPETWLELEHDMLHRLYSIMCRDLGHSAKPATTLSKQFPRLLPFAEKIYDSKTRRLKWQRIIFDEELFKEDMKGSKYYEAYEGSFPIASSVKTLVYKSMEEDPSDTTQETLPTKPHNPKLLKKIIKLWGDRDLGLLIKLTGDNMELINKGSKEGYLVEEERGEWGPTAKALTEISGDKNE